MNILYPAFFSCLLFVINIGCNNQHTQDDMHANDAHNNDHPEEEMVHLSAARFSALHLQIDTAQIQTLSTYIEASGRLEVPPQNEATVTAVIGANVTSIQIIEGQDVRKGQVLAYLSHPAIIELQSEYLKTWHELQYLEKEYLRKKRLYEEEVGSGRDFQKTEATYRSAQVAIKSYEAQFRQLGIDPARVQEMNLYEHIPLRSPIKGTVTQVKIKTGQYVRPDTELFEIVNVEHIHADLMVFEKDILKVEVGQRIWFLVETLPDSFLYANIYSVGKQFEQEPKAVHVHAEIEHRVGKLIPGMYIRGQILTDSIQGPVLPEDAIVRQGDSYFVFQVVKHLPPQRGEEEWKFVPVEVVPGPENNGWVAVDFLEEISSGTQFALNNAYYLMAEMKKSEAEHSH